MSFDPKIAEAAGLLTSKTATNTQKKSNELEQDDFFKMMIAQMKFQNPLQPQDPGKFMEQVTQMSSMQSMKQMEDTFKTMMDASNSGQLMQASSLVGRSVMAPGTSGNYLPGEPLHAQVVLPDAASSLTVEISDASGQLIKTIEMDEQKAGAVDVSWEGDTNDGSQAKAGHYSIKATAMVDGKRIAQEVKTAVEVDSVSVGKNGVALNLLDGRQIGLKDVSEIL